MELSPAKEGNVDTHPRLQSERNRKGRERRASRLSFVARVLNGETPAFSCLFLPIVNPFRTTFGREAKIFATIPDSVCRCSECFVDESRSEPFPSLSETSFSRGTLPFFSHTSVESFFICARRFVSKIRGMKIILDRLLGQLFGLYSREIYREI